MIKSLQSLRFVFALMIFLHHSAVTLPVFGAFPVSFFLILSGFVLMKNYGDRIADMSLREFVTKRILRIYPTHLLCLVIAIIICLWVSYPINMRNTLPSFFMLQAWIPIKDVYFAGNSVSWYVSVIVFCYLIFPFLVKAFNKNTTIIVVLSISLYILGCLFIPQAYQHAFLYINPLFRSVDFILGMWIYLVLRDNKLSMFKCRILKFNLGGKLFVELFALLFSLCAIIIGIKYNNAFTFALLWWIPSLLLIYIFSVLEKSPGLITKILQFKPLVTLGSISYAFYLLHRTVLVANNHFMNIHPINYVLDGFVVLSIIIILAYFVTYYFEPLFKKHRK